MTAPGPRSDRRSGRVTPGPAALAGRGVAGPISAPESLAPRRTAGSGPERGDGRVGRRQLDHLGRDLAERDWAILTSLERFRFLTTGHLQTLHFSHHATPTAAARICRRVLVRLAELRVIEHLERRIGGVRAGSASYVWRVGLIGDRLLRQAAGEGARRRRKEPSARHLDHCLAIANCYLTLLNASRSGALELVSADTEPSCWREYLGAGGSREVLKPDLYVVTATGEFEDHWFFEIDRATESLFALLHQCAQYERYRRTGREQAERGVFPRVVWIVPDRNRADRLTDGLAHARRLDAALFQVITADQLIGTVQGGAA